MSFDTADLNAVLKVKTSNWQGIPNEGTYNNIDGYNWVRVLLSDGRQAFMPLNYLSR